ncbi:hypothetical protein [Cecembia calidifontis]|uniref:SprT-like family protein n=1 Tax=Cecembia calidifontis TaxID=1187080 RepID=A0A4Q7PAW4_9BACT|nr:hypothetical protein [Cecembia calidifontis]RZS96778.1 hypothetical protein BC751_2364 [Cecembia calidifontis]
MANYFLDKIGIEEDLHLAIKFTSDLPEYLLGFVIQSDTGYTSNLQKFKIFIQSNLSEFKLSEVLAHELVHVRQYVERKLEIDQSSNISWMGRRYFYNSNFHRFSPWEKEAHSEGFNLARQLSNDDLDMSHFIIGPKSNICSQYKSWEICRSN